VVGIGTEGFGTKPGWVGGGEGGAQHIWAGCFVFAKQVKVF